MNGQSIIKVAKVRGEYKGQKRSVWDWLGRIIAVCWNLRHIFGNLLKKIRRILTPAFILIPLHQKKNVDTRRYYSLITRKFRARKGKKFIFFSPFYFIPIKLRVKDNSLNHQRTGTANVEENAVIENEIPAGEIIKSKVQATRQSTAIDSGNIMKWSAVVIHHEEMVNKHLENSLDDFILDDDYFEDSWGLLHSNLLLTTYNLHQANTFMSTSLRVAAAYDIGEEMWKQSTHMLKTVHLEGKLIGCT
ncbi:unnamed protein product [Wuchereria bancrofti]|uniref:Uncharacterized protein n=2 Tax=Wuchereria bancrofti TaxID=6293 RepID=A0A3P7DUN4_WUCBA|nr:unnamed protein product [Wuchereria bancrofti]